MKRALPAALSVAIAIAIGSCVTPTPAVDEQGNVTVRKASDSMQSQGLQLFQEYKKKKKISSNSAYQGKLRRVATKLKRVIKLPGARWEFVVFEDSSPNAFALPGGKVGVNSGLFKIATTDAQLATVVSHEIAHVTSNHAQDRVNQQTGIAIGGAILGAVLGGADDGTRQAAGQLYGYGAQVGVGLPFSRSQELEADRIGMIFMAQAGYDPAAAVTLWEKFGAYQRQQGGQQPEFLRTHPLSSTRINALKEFLPVAEKQYRR